MILVDPAGPCWALRLTGSVFERHLVTEAQALNERDLIERDARADARHRGEDPGGPAVELLYQLTEPCWQLRCDRCVLPRSLNSDLLDPLDDPESWTHASRAEIDRAHARLGDLCDTCAHADDDTSDTSGGIAGGLSPA